MKILRRMLIVTSMVVFFYCGYSLVKKNTLRPKLEADTLVVGVCDNCPPYMFSNRSKLVGYDIDLITELAHRMTKQVKFKIMEDAQLIKALSDGEVHLGCIRPHALALSNRIKVSLCYKELEVPVKNTLYELYEDGTFEDLAQRWICLK